ncbi:unnamed protein product [Owenia fusiformis]|uniref:Uncharacterized protein n=1 Tax=Owenia fusiformis TaxID=6347 RepID=A0A8J1XJL0_OWEFU|nr:unnamed protein product [Owenia fusiformis]
MEFQNKSNENMDINILDYFNLKFNFTSFNHNFTPNALAVEEFSSAMTFGIIAGLLCVCAIFINIVSIIVINRVTSYNAVYVLFINLSIADMLCALSTSLEIFPRLMIGGATWYTLHHLTFSAHCHAVSVILFATFYCTSASLLLILAVLRYIAISQPTLYANVSKKWHMRGYIALAWLVSFLISLPGVAAFLHGQDVNILWDQVWPCLLGTIYVIVILLYIKVSISLLRLSNGRRSCTNVKENHKAFATSVILMTMLILTAVPYITVKLIRYDYWSASLQKLYNNLICYIPYVNFITNPIIYGRRTGEIKKGYARLLKGCFGRLPGTTLDFNRNSDHDTLYSKVNRRVDDKRDNQVAIPLATCNTNTDAIHISSG